MLLITDYHWSLQYYLASHTMKKLVFFFFFLQHCILNPGPQTGQTRAYHWATSPGLGQIFEGCILQNMNIQETGENPGFIPFAKKQVWLNQISSLPLGEQSPSTYFQSTRQTEGLIRKVSSSILAYMSSVSKVYVYYMLYVILHQKPGQLSRHKSSVVSTESLDSETFWKQK